MHVVLLHQIGVHQFTIKAVADSEVQVTLCVCVCVYVGGGGRGGACECLTIERRLTPLLVSDIIIICKAIISKFIVSQACAHAFVMFIEMNISN